MQKPEGKRRNHALQRAVVSAVIANHVRLVAELGSLDDTNLSHCLIDSSVFRHASEIDPFFGTSLAPRKLNSTFDLTLAGHSGHVHDVCQNSRL